MSNLEIVKELEKKIAEKNNDVMIHIISKPRTKVSYSQHKFKLRKRNIKWIREAFSINKHQINFFYSPLSFEINLDTSEFGIDILSCEKVKENEYKLLSDVSIDTDMEFLFLI